MSEPISVANVEEILAPAPVESAAAALVAEDAPTESGSKTFALVKNVKTSEDITLEDGTKFRFPGSLFETTDEALYNALVAVADRYSIVKR